MNPLFAISRAVLLRMSRAAALGTLVQRTGWGRRAVQRFVAGRHAITVRPRTAPWPSDLKPDETLAQLLQRHQADMPVGAVRRIEAAA